MIENEKPQQRADREQLQRVAAGCAQLLKGYLPADAGIVFAVVLADVGDKGSIAYASNGNREDMTKALRELLDKVLIEGEAQRLAARRLNG